MSRLKIGDHAVDDKKYFKRFVCAREFQLFAFGPSLKIGRKRSNYMSTTTQLSFGSKSRTLDKKRIKLQINVESSAVWLMEIFFDKEISAKKDERFLISRRPLCQHVWMQFANTFIFGSVSSMLLWVIGLSCQINIPMMCITHRHPDIRTSKHSLSAQSFESSGWNALS